MRRIFNSVQAIVMAALISFPVLLFLERLTLPATPLYSGALRALPLALCYLCGMLTRPLGRRVSVAIFAATAAAGLALTGWLTGGLSLFIPLCIIPAVILYLLGLGTRGHFPVSFCVGGLILYFASIIIIPSVFKLEGLQALSACALAFLALSMFSFNTQGMRLAMHSTGGTVRTPGGLAAKNLLMTLIFIALCGIVSLIAPLKYVFIYPLRWLILLWRRIKALLTIEAPEAAPETEVTEDVMPDLSALGGSEHIEAEWVMYLVYALAALICLALLYFLIRKILKAAGAAGGALGRLAKRFSALFARQETEDYDDSVESLFSLDELLRSGSEAFGAVLGRVTRREPGFDDMPDTTAKLRYAYRRLLRREIKSAPGAAAKTPIELMDGRGEAFEAFAEDYSTARYSEHAPSPAAEDNARAVLKAGKRQR